MNASVSKISEASTNGTRSYFLIDGKPSKPFHAYTDSADAIKVAIDGTFGIGCPRSIYGDALAGELSFDYESGCSWGDDLISETAFCGKCANRNTFNFFNGINFTMTYEYVSR